MDDEEPLVKVIKRGNFLGFDLLSTTSAAALLLSSTGDWSHDTCHQNPWQLRALDQQGSDIFCFYRLVGQATAPGHQNQPTCWEPRALDQYGRGSNIGRGHNKSERWEHQPEQRGVTSHAQESPTWRASITLTYFIPAYFTLYVSLRYTAMYDGRIMACTEKERAPQVSSRLLTATSINFYSCEMAAVNSLHERKQCNIHIYWSVFALYIPIYPVPLNSEYPPKTINIHLNHGLFNALKITIYVKNVKTSSTTALKQIREKDEKLRNFVGRVRARAVWGFPLGLRLVKYLRNYVFHAPSVMCIVFFIQLQLQHQINVIRRLLTHEDQPLSEV